MNAFSYARPRAIADALRYLRSGAVALAGGTDLLGLMKDGLATPAALVDLTGIEGLRGWSHQRGKGLRIGALTPLVELETSDSLTRAMPILREALKDAATVQLRTMGTVGGNLLQRNRCWYFRDEGTVCWLKGGKRCFAVDGENRHHAILGADECVMVSPSDLVPALIAYDAEISLVSARGQRRMKLADLFVTPKAKDRREHALRPAELITEVRVSEASLARKGTYLKAMDRKAWSFALVSVAAAAKIERGIARDVRIVLGGVAPVPWRVVAAEKGLEGSALDDAACTDAADRMLAGATPLRDNGYKVTLARELVRRALRSLVAA
ncbi:MAG: xanthine dehydrogenase family protein subunit M [Chloroflexi bacterium]|nr:MAG: xanthine dehydrogenase family protein subunit M [Chloroflexota bacterium]